MLSLEYMAGLFDGEGCIRVHTPGVTVDGKINPKTNRHFPSYQVLCMLQNTYWPVILALHEQFGGMVTVTQPRSAKHRTIHQWRVQSKIAYAFLRAVRPHLIIKREEAELAIALQEHIHLFKSDLVGPWGCPERKAEIAAYRRGLAEKMAALKRVEHVLSVEDGSAPAGD